MHLKQRTYTRYVGEYHLTPKDVEKALCNYINDVEYTTTTDEGEVLKHYGIVGENYGKVELKSDGSAMVIGWINENEVLGEKAAIQKDEDEHKKGVKKEAND